ncbi:WD repeat-containing protein [Ooceraea biroi]|uniref:WD repeat-containing protein n=1 Tax=Ooceraea biroi TaxID=2015173 RepID=A0A026WDR8_OOCBI|nr:WD repeat-containing protein [Ooceraea biroi]
MPRKGVKYQSSWTLHDENIENVEHVSLAPELQQELGCSVGEHVFLEYPWAYVSREVILSLANVTGSPLEPYQDKIKAYEGNTFLVGYSSTQLSACDFVICLTEEARSAIVKRNAGISKSIRNEVIRRIRKTGRLWKSLGSESQLDERQIRNTREVFEVEVRLPVESLGLNRKLSDRLSEASYDSYVELIPYEKFENIEKKCISRITQTHFEPRDVEMQTYPGHPKSAWTQYVYEDTLNLQADNGASKDEEEKDPLELFLEAHAQEMIDAVCYNTVMNVYVDDIEMLTRRGSEIAWPGDDEITYAERFSLVYLRLTIGKVVSDASWHPSLAGYMAISYVSVPSAVGYDATTSTKSESTVLLWSLDDSL